MGVGSPARIAPLGRVVKQSLHHLSASALLRISDEQPIRKDVSFGETTTTHTKRSEL
jgi:hypothetical protein